MHTEFEHWRQPEPVSIPDDELQFVLIPPEVEAYAVQDVCGQLRRYQQQTDETVESALMVTMGGLGPGVQAYDHLVRGRAAHEPNIAFGTLGVTFYKDVGMRHDKPAVVAEPTVAIAGKVVLVIDDLGDTGHTLRFVDEYLREKGARRVLNMVLYMKPQAKRLCPVDFSFGEVAQDTWIITPREQVEMLVQRVPLWRQRGASEKECRRRLVELIGYSIGVGR